MSCCRRTSRASRSARGSSSPTSSHTRAPASTSCTRCRSPRVRRSPGWTSSGARAASISARCASTATATSGTSRCRTTPSSTPRTMSRPPRSRSPSTSCCSTMSIRVGVLRGGPATHHKYAGRRILGSGINLTHLYKGKISLVEFMLERELGQVSKMYRGHDLEAFDADVLEHRREKPWIAAVDSFAIGGTCQWLLVMDYVIAETGSYFVLPGAQGGDHPGLRQPAPAALRGRAHRPPGALLQPLVPGGQPRGAHARRRGRAGRRHGGGDPACRIRGRERRDDQPRPPTAWPCDRSRSRSTCSGAT